MSAAKARLGLRAGIEGSVCLSAHGMLAPRLDHRYRPQTRYLTGSGRLDEFGRNGWPQHLIPCWVSVWPSPVRGKHDPEPITTEISEAMGESADLLDDQVDGLGAAVADTVGVEVGEHWVRHARRVRPSRATSGIGQEGKLSRTLTAISRPVAGAAW